MSWFARSIANTLNLDDGEDEDTEQQTLNNKDKIVSTNQNDEQEVDDDSSPLSPGRGVKEDLSEITKTLTRQFWGVASFLAPPPPPEHSSEQSEPSDPGAAAPEAISGIRRDFAEIGGRFRTGISKLSNNIDVSEITKMASNFLQIGPEDDDYDSTKGVGAIGVTDDVVAFVRDIAMHPETWLDFPLPEDEDDDEDFDLSDAQQEHCLAVESLVPRLAALRIELCPGYMTESSFWKIYFVLLHPRLESHAADLLSTPEIAKARTSLTQELKNRSNTQSMQEGSRNNSSYSGNISATAEDEHLSMPSSGGSECVTLEISARPSTTSTDPETDKHAIPTEELQMVDKSVIQEEPRNTPKAEDDDKVQPASTSNITETKDEDDADDWLQEESSETVTGTTTVPIENDEDVSFSDLEEDEDDGDAPTDYKKESRDWVQLGRKSSVTIEGQASVHNSETKESNDWLDVDDIDVA